MSMHRTWIRVEDAFGQFDHDKSRPLPNGVTVVEGYAEHKGRWARDPKGFTDKAGKPTDKLHDVEPPRNGAGSGRDAWAGYAKHLGLEVPDEASRDELIALVDASRVSLT